MDSTPWHANSTRAYLVDGDLDLVEALVAALGAEDAGHVADDREARVAAEHVLRQLPDTQPVLGDQAQAHLRRKAEAQALVTS